MNVFSAHQKKFCFFYEKYFIPRNFPPRTGRTELNFGTQFWKQFAFFIRFFLVILLFNFVKNVWFVNNHLI